MVLGALACVNVGATMVLSGESFDAESVLSAVQLEQCTALYGVPTMFISELDHPKFDSYDLSSLRTGMMAGSPCPVEVMKSVISRMNMSEVTIGYGMTELSPLSFQTLSTDSMEKRVGSVGKVHPFVETKIVGADGQTLKCGQQGEIVSRGYLVMKGYWNDPKRTSEAIDEQGWMHTGDLGVIDENGYCQITGRSKDMIIRGGENVYPREIEEYLYKNASVADVQVFGVPDAKLGEKICAWIVLKPGEQISSDDIVSFCHGQIAYYKIPKYIKFVDEFPMTVTGKIQKFVMRDAVINELELGEKSRSEPV
jgi:fatty-acyl-CoA synthase